MIVYYESMMGPMRCRVVREIGTEHVELLPVGVPAGPFGSIEAPKSPFVANKRLCWMTCRPMNRYGTKHTLEGRPIWKAYRRSNRP